MMDPEEIVFLERPEGISWEEISAVLKKAHAENVKNGIVLPYATLPASELYAKTEGRGGKMLVALHRGKVVGTGAVAIIEKNLWCGKGKYAYCFLDAVLPEFRGEGIFRQIAGIQEEYARSARVDRMLFDTHEQNRRMIAISEKNGYRKVDFKVRAGDGHPSVLLVKWLDGCPISYSKCRRKYAWIRLNRLIKSRVKYLIKQL